MENTEIKGHAAALFTILVWGTTYIATKVLLNSFLPVEILVIRFVIGYFTLLLIYPHRLRPAQRKQELLFAAAGLCGVTFYFLFENIALTYTMASNVGVIISIAPILTAILAHLFLDGEGLRVNFFVGFAAAIIGIALISFNGSSVFRLNPVGDMLAVLAAAVWSVYSILTRKIGAYGYPVVATTRRMFFYGIVFMIPAMLLSGFNFRAESFIQPVNILNILFLGLIASALCFVTWNYAISKIGAVKTSIYIYASPVVTIVTSMIVLHEKITWMSALGTALAMAGLFISERKIKNKVYAG